MRMNEFHAKTASNKIMGRHLPLEDTNKLTNGTEGNR